MPTYIEHRIKELSGQGMGDHAIAQRLKEEGYDVTRHRIRRIAQELERICGDPADGDRLTSIKENGDAMEASGVCQARSLEALLALLDVDMDKWCVERWIGNQWGKGDMWQVKAWFKRKTHEQSNLEELIEELKTIGPVRDPGPEMYVDSKKGRALEIAIMDPHMGLHAFDGASGGNYDPAKAEAIWWASIHKIIQRSRHYGPFKRIVFVAGNDFLHADNVFHTTTQGTGQPEMQSWHHTFINGERLLIETVEHLKQYGRTIDVVMVPGNHARQSEFALGRILNAYFHNDRYVNVDAGPEPYKFWRYGVNLIGYEHGHSIKAQKLASLMANERKGDWPEVWQCEWHCGDQHRESAVFSEAGVNIKYLPSMVTWNEWHKIKGFSWAHRASLGFVYDSESGLICTPQVNAKEVFDG